MANTSFFIKTFGCQMNVADTERMHSLLSEAGMSAAENPESADIILINGCSVREKAVHKALSELGRYQFYKEEIPALAGKSDRAPHPQSARQNAMKSTRKKPPIIGVGGCVGQLEKDQLFAGAPYLDFVFGTDTIDELPEILHRVQNGERHGLYTKFDASEKYSTETKVSKKSSQAFVNIMKGCDKYCTYCIVPFTRGREKSRLIDEVLDDLARLVASGVREVTLLGQNVNSFGKNNPNTKNRLPLTLNNAIGKVGPDAGEENFPQLLRAIDADPRLSDLKRVRYTSSHPLDFSDELIECYAPAEKGGVAKLARQLHLPVQSGSNRILQKMGRHHKIENYISQMDRLREIAPDVGITSDIIVGFPTETEEDFQATLALLERVQYDAVYAFAYSPRPGTRAEKLPDDVPDEVKNERLNRLLEYQSKISARRSIEHVGRVMEILVEGEAKNQKRGSETTKIYSGRTSCNRVVTFAWDAPRALTGQFVQAKILRATPYSLHGEVQL